MGAPTDDATMARSGPSGDLQLLRSVAVVAGLTMCVALVLVGPTLAAGALQTGPTANLTVSPSPAAPGETVTLDATASTAGGNETITDCSFDVDGDGTDDVTTQSCVHETAYDAAGDYAVSVRVRTSADDAATDSTTLVVRANRAPVAAFDVDPTDPRPGDEIILSGVDSTDPDGDVVRYRWTVDGRTLRGATVAYRVDAAGDLTIGLEVVDDDGATNTTTRTITVRANRAPSAALFVSPTEPIPGESITLDASDATDADGTITAYRWDTDGDGSVDRETTGATVTLTVDEPGERAASVTVVDDEGATNETTIAYAVLAVATTDAVTTTAGSGASDAPAGADRGITGVLDPGFVPFVPDWLALFLLLLAVGGVVTVRRREAVRARIADVHEQVRTGAFRKRVAKSASGFVVKRVVKGILRRGGDLVEFVTSTAGDAIERVGRAIRHGGERVADFLRKLGS